MKKKLTLILILISNFGFGQSKQNNIERLMVITGIKQSVETAVDKCLNYYKLQNQLAHHM